MSVVAPGAVSPPRPVPSRIPRPPYVQEPSASPYRGPEVKDAETIELMRVAGRIAADALVEVSRAIEPGVTTDELDRIGHEYLCDHDAYPSTLGYRSNTLLGAVPVLGMGLIVWFLISEPRGGAEDEGPGGAVPKPGEVAVAGTSPTDGDGSATESGPEPARA